MSSEAKRALFKALDDDRDGYISVYALWPCDAARLT